MAAVESSGGHGSGVMAMVAMVGVAVLEGAVAIEEGYERNREVGARAASLVHLCGVKQSVILMVS